MKKNRDTGTERKGDQTSSGETPAKDTGRKKKREGRKQTNKKSLFFPRGSDRDELALCVRSFLFVCPLRRSFSASRLFPPFRWGVFLHVFSLFVPASAQLCGFFWFLFFSPRFVFPRFAGLIFVPRFSCVFCVFFFFGCVLEHSWPFSQPFNVYVDFPCLCVSMAVLLLTRVCSLLFFPCDFFFVLVPVCVSVHLCLFPFSPLG